MRKINSDKKFYLLIIFLLSITLIVLFLIKNFKGDKKSKSDTEITKEQTIQDNFLPQTSILSIIPGYKLDNEIMPLSEDGYIKEDKGWRLDTTKSSLCTSENPTDRDPDLCKPENQLYTNIIINEEKRVIIKQLNFYSKDSNLGQQFLDNYKKNLLKNKSRMKCEGGLLFDKNKTAFIYADIEEGSDKENIYKLLDKYKEENGMEYFFRCDQLDKFQ